MTSNNTKYDYLFKIVIAGNCAAGKTSLLERFTDHDFRKDTNATIGAKPKYHMLFIDQKRIKLQIQDTSGIPDFSAVTSSEFRGAHGFLLVYSITDRRSFNELQFWMDLIHETCENPIILLVGTNSDLTDFREVSTTLGEDFAKTGGFQFFETSAKDSTNVERAFISLATELKTKFDKNSTSDTPMPSNRRTSTIKRMGDLKTFFKLSTKSSSFTPILPSDQAPNSPKKGKKTKSGKDVSAAPSDALDSARIGVAPAIPFDMTTKGSTGENSKDSIVTRGNSIETAPIKQSLSNLPRLLSNPSPTPSIESTLFSGQPTSNPPGSSFSTTSTATTIPRNQRGAHGVLFIPSSQIEHNNQQIGGGAQGVAYKTKWKSRDVVLKKLFLSHQDHQQKRSFLRELEVWRNIHHPNCVALFGAVDDSNIVGYVMEYCANGNLQDHMRNGLVLSPLKTADMACKIADVLSVLHDSNIAHRDVKPANIMLDQDFAPKLGDFGLSKMVTTMQASATNLAGTPTHMAPEQYKSGAKHDPLKADIYSFAMLMYELATNTVPFDGLNQFEIHRLIEQGIRPLIKNGTPVGMEDAEQKIWWDLLSRCWAQDPKARPSMSEVHNQLVDLWKTVAERVRGFCCKAHKTGNHDYFLSYRVASESKIVNQLYNGLTKTKRNSGAALKVFLDAKCLPDAEDWQKSFLYGLHHTRIIVPIISAAGLIHFKKAHEENDNVLLEYEHMLSLLTLWKGKIKVFPIFIDTLPRASDYPDLPHITTGKNIRKTLQGILRLQGKQIKPDAIDEVIPALLEKLDELDTGANASLTITTHVASVQINEENIEAFIQVEGEAPRDDSCVEVTSEMTLQSLRTIIAEQLDEFEFEYKFVKVTGTRAVVINKKQESIKLVKDIIDEGSNIILRRIV